MALIIHDDEGVAFFASSHSIEQVTLRYDRERNVVIASGYYESVEVSLEDLLAGGEDVGEGA